MVDVSLSHIRLKENLNNQERKLQHVQRYNQHHRSNYPRFRAGAQLKEDYPILYLENGRVYSGDGNLNWRLAMWQDQIEYMNNEKLIYYGSGYKDKLFVFSVDNTGYGNDRTGLDKTNENIHNYFVQILSRGGLLHLLMFIALYFYIFRIYYINTAKKDILFFAIPILWVSLFDSSMENAHFPIIFYYFLGNLFFSNKHN